MFTMVSNVFEVFLQVFQTYVSNVSFVFRYMLHLLQLDVSKLDRVLHLTPRLCVVTAWPHWCGQAPCACGQAWDVGRGQRRGRPDGGGR
jgi:hypothetical protein